MGDWLYQKQPGGTWYGTFYDHDGNRVQVCTKCKDRRAARDALRELERSAHSPTGAAQNSPTHALAEALEYLVSRSSSDAAPGTIRMYATKGGHLLRILGSLSVSDLRLDH